MSSNQIRDEIKHIDYLQKKGMSGSALRQANSDLARKILQHNDARTQEIKRQNFNRSLDTNAMKAREFYNKEAKGRIYR